MHDHLEKHRHKQQSGVIFRPFAHTCGTVKQSRLFYRRHIVKRSIEVQGWLWKSRKIYSKSEHIHFLFLSNEENQDAVIRNLEVIGEAAGKVPEVVREKAPTVEWRKVIGLRNILIHEYFGVSIPMVWDILQKKPSPLKTACLNLQNDAEQ